MKALKTVTKAAFFVATLFVLMNCSKRNGFDLSQDSSHTFKDYSGYNFETLVYFDIPEAYRTDSEYTGTFDTLVEDVVWDFDTVAYYGFYFMETDEDGCVNRIGFTEELVDAFNMPTDIFIWNEEFNDWSELGMCGGSGKVQAPMAGILNFLRDVFIGVPKTTPCVMHVQNCYYDHWLVGPHSFRSCGPCDL